MTSTEKTLFRDIVDRIVSALHPEKIVLFGSRARGQARAGSDIDLLIVAHSTRPRYQRSPGVYGLLSDILIPMDIVVYTPQEIEEWRQVPQAFVTTALREGKVLYENQSGSDQKLVA